MSIELGPFKLIRPIGKGGMGVVWHGVHTGTGVPVAVKVITQRVSRDERTLKAFRNEVRAVAGLDHPGVVWVLDYGEVSTEASIASGRQLTEGSPYLVMEMATGGTLSAYKDGLPWSDLKGMLLGLLDALSHAHARGVIHRDLKPGNVLICSPDDLRPGLKLTDFGIAHAREETVSDSMSNHVIGTLHYMAPEQIRADWRDYGPWTDLYALGTIAYRLTTGVLPFKGKRGASLMVAQLNHRPPPLLPIHPVPDGFEDWLLTMLRKEHSRRFQTAADASMALASLCHPQRSLSPRRPVSLSSDSSRGLLTSIVLDDEPHTMEILDDGGDVTAPTLPPMTLGENRHDVSPRRGEFDRLRPPVPLSWQRPSSSEEGGIQLRGAGLGLWGLRAVSLIGRVAERDAIWETLRDVSHSRQTRVAVVRGVKGVGKTALVQWLVERAVELGAAHLMRCDYGADEQPEEGLRLMMRRFFKVARLDADARRQRVIEICDSFGETDEADAIRVERTLDPVDPLATDGGERHAALRWFLAKVASDRPLILWMDGAHQGMDGLQLVLGMLRASSARILVILSVDDEALKERRLERSFLDRIVKSPSTTVVPVEPLSEIELATHIRENLGLAASLAHEVARQSGGLPQYATQVVGEWVGKGALRRGPEGYVLLDGERVPRSMDQVWDQRIEQLLDGLPAGTDRMLALAAVLGDAVNEGEWATVCDDPEGKLRASGGAPINPRHVRARSLLVDRLLAAALVEERDDGWAFLVDALRTALNERTNRLGRMAEYHGIVAAMLEEQGAAAERRGHHLVASGDLDAGIDALLGGVRERLAAVGPRPALALLEKASDVLDRARIPTTDPRRGRVWCTHGELAIQRGRLDEAEKRALQVLHTKGRRWIDAHARAYFLQGNVALLRKQAEVGREAFLGFSESAPASGLLLHRAAMHHALSLFAEAEGDAETATQQARLAASMLADYNGDLLDVWKLLGMRGLVSSRAGTLLVNLERRRRSYESIGQREGTAECWMVLASASRRGNRSNLAARCLEHAARLFDRANTHAAHRPRLQLALLRCAAGNYALAEREAVEVATKVRDAHRKPVLLKAHALLAVCAAGRDRWALLGDHIDVIRVLIADTEATERDVGWCMMRAGELARRGAKVGPARQCLTLALHQYQKLGDAKHTSRVSKLLGSLPRG